MTNESEELQSLLTEMATLIEQKADPDPQLYTLFFQQPELAFKLVDLINNLEEHLEEGLSVYSACVFALDICVAQLQGAAEADNKVCAKTLSQLMEYFNSVESKTTKKEAGIGNNQKKVTRSRKSKTQKQ